MTVITPEIAAQIQICLAEGLAYPAIAAKLGIKRNTISSHIERLQEQQARRLPEDMVAQIKELRRDRHSWAAIGRMFGLPWWTILHGCGDKPQAKAEPLSEPKPQRYIMGESIIKPPTPAMLRAGRATGYRFD